MKGRRFGIEAVAVVLFCVIIAGPAALAATEAAGVDVPSRLAGDDAAYLIGSKGESRASDASALSFADGSMQRLVEETLDARIPFKFDVMLATAACQRHVIELANVPFGWNAKPTFFGSAVVCHDDLDALVNMPYVAVDARFDEIDWFCGKLAGFASRHPDVDFYLVAPCGTGFPPVSPVYEMMGNPLTGKMVASRLRDDLAGIPNVAVVSDDGLYPTPEEYYQAYYRTDHHWNIRGTEAMYRLLAREMGKEPVAFGEVEAIAGVEFNGSNARKGLLLLGEEVIDTPDAFADVEFVSGSGEHRRANDRPAIEAGDGAFAFNFYDEYYRDAPEVVSDRPGRALLVRDSFGRTLAAPMGTLFGYVRVSNALHMDSSEPSLEELVGESDPDAVVLVATAPSIFPMKDGRPDFFD